MTFIIFCLTLLSILCSVSSLLARIRPTRSILGKIQMTNEPTYNAVMIVPTGIGASIGGFAGDALPSAKLLASIVDTLILHPNVVNGAMMYWPISNALYVEGFALDEFAMGKIALSPKSCGHNIGLLLDAGIERDLQIRHLQVANAARATLGINVAQCVITSRPIGVKLKGLSLGGASWGCIEDIETLLEGATKLIEYGCTAIAVVARFPEDDDVQSEEGAASSAHLFEEYRMGKGVDSIAGAEALISHLITKHFMVPCAHAPAFEAMDADDSVAPKACAEELGYTFLPCVLANLHRAPRLINLNRYGQEDFVNAANPRRFAGNESHDRRGQNYLTARDVDAVVVPASALGGSAVLSFLSQGKLVIAVEDNKTTMQVFPEDLQMLSSSSTTRDLSQTQVVRARSYAEAAGLLAAHKAGIMFDSLTSIVPPIPVHRSAGN